VLLLVDAEYVVTCYSAFVQILVFAVHQRQTVAAVLRIAAGLHLNCKMSDMETQ